MNLLPPEGEGPEDAARREALVAEVEAQRRRLQAQWHTLQTKLTQPIQLKTYVQRRPYLILAGSFVVGMMWGSTHGKLRR